jgi:O-antigen ligase
MNTGVSTDKNMLGVMLLVISLGTLWHIAILFRAKRQPDRGRHLLAQSTLLVFGIVLLKMANSQTSVACFVIGGAIILATSMDAFRRRPARVHALCLSFILVAGFTLLLGGGADVVHAMGRKATLSGRTVIWAAVIPAAPNAIVGAGFEDFWISPNVVKFQQALVGWWHPEELNEAHNGYIEVYLNLGCIGVVLICALLISGYARAAKALRMNPSVGGLLLAYIIVAAVYSITEAGFRMLDLIWVFLLIAIVSANSVAGGLIRGDALTLGTRDRTASRTAAGNQLNAGKSTIYASAD